VTSRQPWVKTVRRNGRGDVGLTASAGVTGPA
jgi:hypothetical protein